MKKVIFKGEKEKKGLKKGKEYDVLYVNERMSGTYYILAGVVGEFNSNLFYDADFEPTIKIGISKKIPVVGESCSCFVVNSGVLIKSITSLIRQVTLIGPNTYEVKTLDEIYIIQVQKY